MEQQTFNMSGHVSGVSARLEQLYPNARYFSHCRNHALNLVIVASCNAVMDIRNFMTGFKELTLFFGWSSKRKHILRKHFRSDKEQQDLLADIEDENDSELESGSMIPNRKYQSLPVLSDTRWLTRVDSIDCLLKHFTQVCHTIEEVRDSSTGQSASDADAFLRRMLCFEFVASAVISHHVLTFTRPLSVALQAKQCDLLEAHKMAQRLIKTLEKERNESSFSCLWDKITAIGKSLDVQPAKKELY